MGGNQLMNRALSRPDTMLITVGSKKKNPEIKVQDFHMKRNPVLQNPTEPRRKRGTRMKKMSGFNLAADRKADATVRGHCCPN